MHKQFWWGNLLKGSKVQKWKYYDKMGLMEINCGPPR
jgi:hypothetical protein